MMKYSQNKTYYRGLSQLDPEKIYPITYSYENPPDSGIGEETFKEFVKECEEIITNDKFWKTIIYATGEKTTDGHRKLGYINVKFINNTDKGKKCSAIDFRNGYYGQNFDRDHMTISLTSKKITENKYCTSLPDDENIPLSCTHIEPTKQKKIYINLSNWNGGFCKSLQNDGYDNLELNDDLTCTIKNPTSDKSKKFARDYPAFAKNPELMLECYRKYVICHEVGHALGRGHSKRPGESKNKLLKPGQLCPIMIQQTKGLDGMAINVFPLDPIEQYPNQESDIVEYLY